MIRTFAPLPALLLTLILGACGWAEWPPPDDGPKAGNRPVVSSPNAFVNASAVIVGPGDTIYGLSRRHRVAARSIIEANDLKPPYYLSPGQRLVLPRGRTHTVNKGDTLSTIAEAYRVDMYAVARLNRLVPPYIINIGQKLSLPDAGSGGTMTVATAPVPPPPRSAITAKVPAQAKAIPPPPTTGKGFVWPVRGRVVSRFGGKDKGLHNDGVNIAAPRGTPVMAIENGIVAYAGNELRGFGNLLLIKHADGWISAYAHNEALLVKRGDQIVKGQDIARVGSTGSVKTPQLHFELRRGKTAVDPIKYLPAA